MMKPKSILCYCDKYDWPHRKGSGRCQELWYCKHGYHLVEHDDYNAVADYCKECERLELEAEQDITEYILDHQP